MKIRNNILPLTLASIFIWSSQASASYAPICKQIIQNIAPHYKELWASIESRKDQIDQTAPIFKLLTTSLEECQNNQKAKEVYVALGRYTKKVGLIISDPRSSSFSEVIIENIKNYFKKRAQTNTRKVVILHPDATSLSITRRIAEAVFIHQVGALAGGESYNEAWVLHTWAEKLRIPTFILYPNIATEQEPKHSFTVNHILPLNSTTNSPKTILNTYSNSSTIGDQLNHKDYHIDL